jgi:hypothetical protein
MRARNITTGFHRIGLLLLAIFGVPGCLAMGNWAFGSQSQDALAFGGLFFLAGSILWLSGLVGRSLGF